MPCKDEVTRNILNVKQGKPLTQSLAYLNRSCNFRKRYALVVGEFEKQSKEEIKAKMKEYKREYRQRPENKAKEREYKREYHLRMKNQHKGRIAKEDE